MGTTILFWKKNRLLMSHEFLPLLNQGKQKPIISWMRQNLLVQITNLSPRRVKPSPKSEYGILWIALTCECHKERAQWYTNSASRPISLRASRQLPCQSAEWLSEQMTVIKYYKHYQLWTQNNILVNQFFQRNNQLESTTEPGGNSQPHSSQ